MLFSLIILLALVLIGLGTYGLVTGNFTYQIYSQLVMTFLFLALGMKFAHKQKWVAITFFGVAVFSLVVFIYVLIT